MSGDSSVQWAMDLLAPDPEYQENFLSKYYHYIIIPASTLGACAYFNYMTRKPVFAGISKYAIALVLGVAGAKVIKDMKTHRESERDAILRHYIRTHPDDFPAPERKTYNQVFEEWVPIR